MTVQQAIAAARGFRPSAYDDATLARWLSDLDGQVYESFMAGREGAPESAPEPYSADAPGAALLIPAPFEDVYVKYLLAQMEYANGEFARYNNAVAMYNALLQRFAAWYNRTHAPLQPNAVKL